jgi:hypothetical protein
VLGGGPYGGGVSDAVLSLLAATLGGVLVLLGDGVRRRAERIRLSGQQLFDAAVALAIVHNRLAGVLIDAHDGDIPLADVPLPGAQRYEAQTRFWATPGSTALTEPASALSLSWRLLLEHYTDPDGWPAACQRHRRALWEFEAAIRAAMGDRSPLRHELS